MANFAASGTCPNCSYTGELADPSGPSLGVIAKTLWKSWKTPFWGLTASNTYNGTHWCCPSCGHRLIECNTCHTINSDATTSLGDKTNCRSCGKRIT